MYGPSSSCASLSSSIAGASISDSDILNRNKFHALVPRVSEESKLLLIGKRIGASFHGVKQERLSCFKLMEERDKKLQLEREALAI
jgi:hypothetical protein